MATVTIPYRFADGDRPGAAPFNSNFDAIATAVNSTDGTVTANSASITTNTTNMAKIGSKGFYAATSTNTSITSGNTTTVTLDAEVTDPDNTFNTTTYKYIPAQTGIYLLAATVKYTTIATATLNITKNAAGSSATNYSLGATDVDNSVVSGVVVLESDDTNDEFYITVTAASGDATVSRASFSGCCIRPD